MEDFPALGSRSSRKNLSIWASGPGSSSQPRSQPKQSSHPTRTTTLAVYLDQQRMDGMFTYLFTNKRRERFYKLNDQIIHIIREISKIVYETKGAGLGKSSCSRQNIKILEDHTIVILPKSHGEEFDIADYIALIVTMLAEGKACEEMKVNKNNHDESCKAIPGRGSEAMDIREYNDYMDKVQQLNNV